MGWSFRKNIKVGPARVNVSKSGVGYSVGAGGVRYTKRAGSKKKDKGSTIGESVKGFLYLVAAIVAITLILNYWKWILGIAAVVAAVAGGYWIYAQKQDHAQTEDDLKLQNNDPASE